MDLKYSEHDGTDNAQPGTSRGNAQTMEAIKTTQNPYYCGDDVQLEDNVTGIKKAISNTIPYINVLKIN